MALSCLCKRCASDLCAGHRIAASQPRTVCSIVNVSTPHWVVGWQRSPNLPSTEDSIKETLFLLAESTRSRDRIKIRSRSDTDFDARFVFKHLASSRAFTFPDRDRYRIVLGLLPALVYPIPPQGHRWIAVSQEWKKPSR